jgi:opacity protein-like surface antigen
MLCLNRTLLVALLSVMALAGAGLAGENASSVSAPAAASAANQSAMWLEHCQASLFGQTATSAPADSTSGGSSGKPKENTYQSTCEKPWEIKFKAYGWLAGVDGNAGIGRAVSHLNVDYCDLIDNLDLVECMVPVNLEARYQHWGIYADLFYVRLEDQVRRNRVNVNLEFKQAILELGGFYRVGTWPTAPNTDSSITLDVLAGARYNRLEGNVGLETPERSISVGGTREWWDPFVGPRVIWQANEKLSLFARGDVGGFYLEHSSHFAWQIIAGADYDITKNFFIELGYRLLDTNFQSGSGPRHFTYDVRMQGPYLALGVKF